ncbi:MAG TPA: hypothetical protein DCO71_04570 [Gammaproteobacteria bacterium]|nr:hypothetical protein [Gammaproteobacteria bacterium]
MNIIHAISNRFRKKQAFHYARISSLGICNAVIRLDYPVDRANTIPVTGLDTSLIGKRWIGNRWTG